MCRALLLVTGPSHTTHNANGSEEGFNGRTIFGEVGNFPISVGSITVDI